MVSLEAIFLLYDKFNELALHDKSVIYKSGIYFVKQNNKLKLLWFTHYGLMMPYGDIDLSQH